MATEVKRDVNADRCVRGDANNLDAGKAQCQGLSTGLDSLFKRRERVALGVKGAMKVAEPISEERAVRLRPSETESLHESLSSSCLKLDSPDSPYDVRRVQLAELDRIVAKLRAAR